MITSEIVCSFQNFNNTINKCTCGEPQNMCDLLLINKIIPISQVIKSDITAGSSV